MGRSVCPPFVHPGRPRARDTLRMEKGYLLSGQDFLWPGISTFCEGLPDGFLSRTTSETSVPFGLDLFSRFYRQRGTNRVNGKRGKTSGCSAKKGAHLPGPDIKFSGPADDSELVGHVTSGGPSPSLGMDRDSLGILRTMKRVKMFGFSLVAGGG